MTQPKQQRPRRSLRRRPQCPWFTAVLAAAVVYVLGSLRAPAQLAITEVMSWASTNCPGCTDNGPAGCHPDFWELTNFGTNRIDLTGYLFVDKDRAFPGTAPPEIVPAMIIGPNESVIFLRTWDGFNGAADFRRWWGESNLPPGLQIVCCYDTHLGFDYLGDAVRLFDPHSNVVDEVFFDQSQNGFTFTYDTVCGDVVQSALGVCDAFQAANCRDVGSPGFAPCGPVPLCITQQPVSQEVDADSDVTFSVQACGVPRPRGYEWYFNGAALATTASTAGGGPTLVNYAGCGLGWKTNPKATDLTIPNVRPDQAGQYFVVLTNGLERMTSAVVTLTVNTTPSPPRIDCLPPELCLSSVPGRPETNLVVTPLQTAQFAVRVRGYPAPTFRWSWSTDGTNFTNLPNATNDTLVVNYVNSGHAGTYRVRFQNPLGTNYAYAGLSVKLPPRLKITEAMSDGCLPAGDDWWELTNLGDEPVNLCGYRWDDGPGNIGGSPIITNRVIIQPGESVIMLEALSPDFFIQWWGASNLPPNLQFISYTANGLSSEGDEINLWNPTATDDFDLVDSVVFSFATPGASFWFGRNDPCSEFGVANVDGKCGAFHAVQGCDVGSPGWTAWTPPWLTSIRPDGADVKLEWKAQPGSSTVVQYATELGLSPGAAHWIDLGTYSFAGATCSATHHAVIGESPRFYRVKMVAPADCPCP